MGAYVELTLGYWHNESPRATNSEHVPMSA